MGNNGISPMITSMKSTHERVPFKDSVVRLYSTFMLNIVELTLGNKQRLATDLTPDKVCKIHRRGLRI